MAGGLIQIVNHGTMDLTLTGNPEITFFNIIYRRYTNFGLQLRHISFDNDTIFDNTSIITLPKIGQLLSKLILKIDLPEVNFSEINEAYYNESYDKYYSQYIVFFNFYNKLRNIVNNFFSTDYFSDTEYYKKFPEYVLLFLSYNDYISFYTSVSYFFNENSKKYTDNDIYNPNISTLGTYFNAALFRIIDKSFSFIYLDWDKTNLNFDIFKEYFLPIIFFIS